MTFLLLVLWFQAPLALSAEDGGPESYLPIVPSLDKFAGNLFAQVAAEDPNKNVFLSSINIASALVLLALGAKGPTHREIFEGLSLDSSASPDAIYKGFQRLQQVMDQDRPSVALSTTNACFVDKTLNLLQEYQEKLKLFRSEAIAVDFTKPEEAKDQINCYVEEKTRGMIKDFVDSVDPDTVLTIISIIHFKGTWVDVFDKKQTRFQDFYVDESTAVKVPMMSRTGSYPVAFLNNEGCKVVEVPYKGNFSAVFIIPDKGKMQDVEEAIGQGSLTTWMKKLRPMRIKLEIPKFSVSTLIDLKEVLEKLGIKTAFTNSADLSGIAESGELKVSKVVHKAEITVDEEGTEAAAVTGIQIMPTILPPVVRVDAPFLIFIIDTNTNVQLFTGRIRNPLE
ncbi:alpha-1-antitrypsin-like protein GS55-MS [Anomaloglossus baeobatrachus]|uniref:alpha-1-antitrypsin-like protein GS55-MS n=1 Tax=Anomaloglossus baeobatrachus TaxID=238106 RepID=UPI003F5024CB